jgi:hypothetical protein
MATAANLIATAAPTTRTGKPAPSSLSVVFPESRVSGSVQIDLSEFRQFNSLCKSVGTGTLYNVCATVKPSAARAASPPMPPVIDALTQDSTFVSAQ